MNGSSVRTFPSRVVAASLAALVLGAPLLSAPASAQDGLRDRQHQVQGRVKNAQGDLEESSKALAAAGRRLVAARTALAGAQRRLEATQRGLQAAAVADALAQRRLQVAEHRLAVARVALDAARDRVVEGRAAIGRLAASNYAAGDPALMGLSVMLNSQDPAEVTSQLNTVDSLMSRQTTELAALKAARAAMVAEEAGVERAKGVVAGQRRASAARLVAKQALERSAVASRAEVARLVAGRRAAEAQAAGARRADAVQLRALKGQESRIRKLIMARAARQSGGYRGDSGGVLLAPVPGYVTSPYGWRKHPIYGYWGLHDGTDFHAPCGTANRASRAGTVISEQWSEVYGHRLYLDVGQVNGKNMTVVYNHLSSYAVGTGAKVARGQTVGYAGTTGWSTGCHLHFTVLLDGQPVNPMAYIG